MVECPGVKLAHLRLAAGKADPVGGRKAEAALVIFTGMGEPLGRGTEHEGNSMVHDRLPSVCGGGAGHLGGLPGGFEGGGQGGGAGEAEALLQAGRGECGGGHDRRAVELTGDD